MADDSSDIELLNFLGRRRPRRLGRAGTTLSDARIDTERLRDIVTDNPARKPLKNRMPLMMMPLRLEYRFIKAQKRPALIVNDDLAEMTAKFETLAELLPTPDRDRLKKRFARENQLNLGRAGQPRITTNGVFARIVAETPNAVDIGKVKKIAKVAFDQLRATPDLEAKLPLSFLESHLLMRWYPDENFAEKGVATPNEEELAALGRLNMLLGGKNWWETDDADVSPAWQAFVAEVGAARAVHLKRTEGAVADPNWEKRIGRISALPKQVALFAIVNNTPQLLATGKPIPPNTKSHRSPVSYTPEALGGLNSGDETWLSDFNNAIKQGMGIRITAKSKVQLAKEAQWVVAIGLHKTSGALDTTTEEIETMIDSRIATGEFAFLAQDSNTNNTPDQPTEYHLFDNDTLGFTKKASSLERGAFASKGQTAVDLFSEALGFSPENLRKAIRADDKGFEDACAMIRVIGPALLDDALDGSTVLDGVDENAFISVLAGGVVARGALPALRFGSSAYGVMPIANVSSLGNGEDDGLSKTDKKVHEFLKNYAKMGLIFLPAVATWSTPVMEPDGDNPEQIFEAVLKTNRVSTRVEVTDSKINREQAKAIGCAYVYGTTDSRRPTSYFKKLRTDPINSLPDPTEKDRSWPLLYRLARMSLTRNTYAPILAEKFNFKVSLGNLANLSRSDRLVFKQMESLFSGKSVATLSQDKRLDSMFNIEHKTGQRITRVNADFASALIHLERIAAGPQGVAELEVLMMEVFDLFQYRVDAFAVGLAYLQLKRDRANGTKGLAKGYYGILSKLRPDSDTGANDGYILAPSTPQAVTSAVMRSAYLRHKAEGAFAIDLSSRRVRRALQLLDLISKGHSLSETMGMRGERWLHDAREDDQILPLRIAFPIPGENGVGSAGGSRVFDGLAFLEAAGNDDNAVRGALKKQLADDIDAFADIVMAEATHQRAMGAADVANAWLKVLSGDMPPGRPTFLRTHRTGHASTHKVSLMRKPAKAGSVAGPRELAEPTLAEMAKEAMPDFAAAKIAVSPQKAGEGAPAGQIEIRLKADLGLHPIDLVIGGASELQVRAKHHIIRTLLENPQAMSTLNAKGDATSFVANLSGLSVDLGHGQVDVGDYLDRAEQLRNLAQSSRPLEPSDLNAMAPAEHGILSETEEVTMVEFAVGVLNDRVQAVSSDLDAKIVFATAALNSFETLTTQAAAKIANDAASVADVTNAIGQAELGRRKLLDSLEGLAVFGEPSLLKVFLLEEAITDGEAVTTQPFRDAFNRLAKRSISLKEAQAKPVSGFTELPLARARLLEQIAALRSALDGDALPILPPYPRDLLKTQGKFKPRVALATVLSDWAGVRRKVGELRALAQIFPSTSALPVGEDATLDDADDPTAAARSEEEAPRSAHFEHVFGPQDEVKGKSVIAGFVADEWSEARPSNIQSAGLAVNYDSPQSEPPHCILLGVPPEGNTTNWTEKKAAAIVNEAIAWMQIRSLSSANRLTPTTLFPNANQVSAKSQTKNGRRIPNKPPTMKQVAWELGDGLFSTLTKEASMKNMGTDGAGIIERLGFSRLKE